MCTIDSGEHLSGGRTQTGRAVGRIPKEWGTRGGRLSDALEPVLTVTVSLDQRPMHQSMHNEPRIRAYLDVHRCRSPLAKCLIRRRFARPREGACGCQSRSSSPPSDTGTPLTCANAFGYGSSCTVHPPIGAQRRPYGCRSSPWPGSNERSRPPATGRALSTLPNGARSPLTVNTTTYEPRLWPRPPERIGVHASVRAWLRYVLLVTTGVLGGVLPDGLVTRFVPVLGRSLDVGFNVFDVMHHGLHEKQISNVFRWLLESEGTHGLGERFARIFIDEVNRALPGREPLPHDQYWVRQEVNTAPADVEADFADLVLESSGAVLVVENYLTSDGHGHSYDRYLAYAQRDGRRGVVVLLCRDEDASLQTMGWENAPVLTYATLVDRLHEALAEDHAYRRKHPEAHSFIDQMHRKFVKDRGRMEDSDVLGFVVAMCDSGEARRYQEQRQDVAAERFASDLAAQARQRFGEGRELLQRAKGHLRSFSAGPLKRQLNATLGEVRRPRQRTVLRHLPVDDQLRHRRARRRGPRGTAAAAEVRTVGLVRQRARPTLAAHGRPGCRGLLLPAPHPREENKELRQLAVTLHEVLDGLEPTDHRLHDEIVRMLSDDR